MSDLTASEISFVVPGENGLHFLYLKDGRIVRISSFSGEALNVARLPSHDSLTKLESKNASKGDSPSIRTL